MSVLAFLSQRRRAVVSICETSVNWVCAAANLPAALRAGSSKDWPLQNSKFTCVGVTLYPTTGFSPMNQTGLPCHIFEVALGRAASISLRNARQIAESLGDCALV